MTERDYESELASIYNALAESVIDAPVADLEEEIRAEGDDPDEVVARVKRLFRASFEQSRKERGK